MPGRAWTQPEKDLVKKLWLAGESARAISKQLDRRSHQAVISLCDRSDWRRDPSISRGISRNKCRSRKTKGQEYLAPKSGERSNSAVPVQHRHPPRVHDDDPIPFEQLTDRCCKFPVTKTRPFLFCGAPSVDGGPYCSAHMQIAHRSGGDE